MIGIIVLGGGVNILKGGLDLNSMGLHTNYCFIVLRVKNGQVRFEEDVGSLAVDGKNYSLKQMHWHTPAEHVIDGNK